MEDATAAQHRAGAQDGGPGERVTEASLQSCRLPAGGTSHTPVHQEETHMQYGGLDLRERPQSQEARLVEPGSRLLERKKLRGHAPEICKGTPLSFQQKT